MYKSLVILLLFAPLTMGITLIDISKNEIQKSKFRKWVLRDEKFIGRHPCASDSVCDCWVGEATMRLSIDCSNRNLTEPPKMFKALHITKLNLSGNMLRRAPNMTADGYRSVHYLNLSDNLIDKITGDLVSPDLRILDLSKNKISRIEEDVLTKLSKKKILRLYLNDNPWICDCQSYRFVELVKRKFYQIGIFFTKCVDTGELVFIKDLESLCPGGTTISPLFILSDDVY